MMTLVEGLQSSAFFLADAMLATEADDHHGHGATTVTHVIVQENLLLEVQVSREPKRGAGSNASFPSSGYRASQVTGERIVVPKKAVDALRDERGEVRGSVLTLTVTVRTFWLFVLLENFISFYFQVRLVFAAYDKVADIFNNIQPPPEIEDNDHVIIEPIDPVSEKEKGNWTVNSRVLSASVEESKEWTPLREPVSITFVNEIPVSKDAGKRDDAGMGSDYFR